MSRMQLFGLVQVAKKPSHKYVTRDKVDVVTSSNALMSADTGTILPAVSHKIFLPDKKLEDRFPKVSLGVLQDTRCRCYKQDGQMHSLSHADAGG